MYIECRLDALRRSSAASFAWNVRDAVTDPACADVSNPGRTYGVLHGVIDDFSNTQGYMIRIEEHQESRWIALPDPDVDFVQRVNSSGTVQVKSPRIRAIPRGFHCQKV